MKITRELTVDADEKGNLFLTLASESESLTRAQAIKLRNYLNDFINGNLEDEHEL